MLIFAVSVTDCPTLDGLRLDAIVMTGVAAAALTVWGDEPVPGSNEASPSNRASMVCAPAASPAVVSDALPDDSARLPRSVAPSKNCTVPAGEPAAGAAAATVAVNVMS